MSTTGDVQNYQNGYWKRQVIHLVFENHFTLGCALAVSVCLGLLPVPTLLHLLTQTTKRLRQPTDPSDPLDSVKSTFINEIFH